MATLTTAKELFQLKGLQEFIDFAKDQVNIKYNLLDPQGKEEGEFVAQWKLRLNIGRHELERIINKEY